MDRSMWLKNVYLQSPGGKYDEYFLGTLFLNTLFVVYIWLTITFGLSLIWSRKIDFYEG